MNPNTPTCWGAFVSMRINTPVTAAGTKTSYQVGAAELQTGK